MMNQDASLTDDQVDQLHPYVVKENLVAVRKILTKNPHLVNKLYSGETLLDYPCRYGNADMVNLLIECGIYVNNCNKIGSPPLVYAITYNHFDIVKILIQNKAKVEGIVIQDSLTMMDLTILHGRFQAAQYIYNLLSKKELRTPEEYEKIAKKFFLKYVNYSVFIDGVTNGKSVEEIGDFETRPILTATPDDEDPSTCCCCFSWFWSSDEKEKSVQVDKRMKSERQSDADTERKRFTPPQA